MYAIPPDNTFNKLSCHYCNQYIHTRIENLNEIIYKMNIIISSNLKYLYNFNYTCINYDNYEKLYFISGVQHK